LHRMVDEMPDLIALRDIGPDGGVMAERKLLAEGLQPFDAPCTQYQSGTILGETFGNGSSDPARRSANICAGWDGSLSVQSFDVKALEAPLFMQSSIMREQ